MAASDGGWRFEALAQGGLAVRAVVGIILAIVALAALWAGGWAFALLVGVAVLLAFREWAALTGFGRLFYTLGLALTGAIVLMTQSGYPWEALLLLCAGTLLLSLAARTPWVGAGIAWIGLPTIALIWLRAQPDGFYLALWTMATVWVIDSLAYFSGRAIGGPRIAPAISPSKTWAGLGGGVLGAALFAFSFATAGWISGAPIVMAMVGAVLAVVAQAGDFFESWLKRRAGVKDSGRLLPGHGGVLDRIDGLIPVAICVGLWMATR